MQTDDGPLLLLVQANVAPEHEAAFNAWYYHHVPRLLEIPGFNWGRRYVGVRGTTKYLALYELEDAAVLGRMYGPEGRDARAIDERARFDALQGLTDVRSNVYIQRSGTHLSHPLLREDKVVSIVMCDCVVPEQEAAFNDWYDRSHVPNLTRVPGYASGARFQLFEHPVLAGRGQGPKYLALYEIDSLEAVPGMADPDHMSVEARAELARWQDYGVALVDNLSWNVYRPIATHWPFLQG